MATVIDPSASADGGMGGQHQHNIGDVVGLAESLASRPEFDKVYTKTEVDDALGTQIATLHDDLVGGLLDERYPTSSSVATKAAKATTKVSIYWTGLAWSQPRPPASECPAGMAEYLSQLHEDAPWPHDDPTSGILAGDIVERHPNAPGPA